MSTWWYRQLRNSNRSGFHVGSVKTTGQFAIIPMVWQRLTWPTTLFGSMEGCAYEARLWDRCHPRHRGKRRSSSKIHLFLVAKHWGKQNMFTICETHKAMKICRIRWVATPTNILSNGPLRCGIKDLSQNNWQTKHLGPLDTRIQSHVSPATTKYGL